MRSCLGSNRPHGQGPGFQCCEVSRPISNQRHSFFPQGGHHHLSHFPFRHHLQAVGIEYFQNIIVSPVMHAVMGRAFQSCARAVEFGHSRNVVHVGQAEQILYPVPHGIRRALGTIDHFLEPKLVPHTPAFNLLGEQQSHGCCATHDRIWKSIRNSICISRLPGPAGTASAPNFSHPS